MNPQCKEIDSKITNEVYGVKNGIPFSLKINDHTNSVTTMNRTFQSCNADTSTAYVSCGDDSIHANANFINGYVNIGNNFLYCNIFYFGLVGCAKSTTP